MSSTNVNTPLSKHRNKIHGNRTMALLQNKLYIKSNNDTKAHECPTSPDSKQTQEISRVELFYKALTAYPLM